MYNILSQDIKYLPGVGPKRKDLLQRELGIETYGDLLQYFPYKHVDRSKLYAVNELSTEAFVQVKGRILSFEEYPMGPRKIRIVGHFTDGAGICDLVWFLPKKPKNFYQVNTEYIIFGKPTIYGGRYQFAHPEMDKADSLQLSEMGMQPYYITTEKMKKAGLTSRSIEKLTKTLLQQIREPLPETLPPFIVNRLHFVSRDSAFRHIHYPKSADELSHATERLKFEELFYVQLNILRYAQDQRRKYRGYVFQHVGAIFNDFYNNHLPFP